MFFRNDEDSLKSGKRKAIEEMEELNELRENQPLEKGDVPALIIAAITTLLPIGAIIVLAYYLISMFIFG
ncbi:hypothetical protein [Treponema putidum]|uniref:Uncharacterized protein n=1 Tax=Treponema putidum TaxID=221027 RepID=A0ABY5HUA4_9SPIR|nr:hypothetical protein [Treponema putidum]AIN92762.1 hypothetical protein JO40_00295 [Treponema putidum]TWI75233.1 hypothetical protein JM98_01998 [Treponema putidum]UTY29003.1 hypothetical protein E4N76_08410 [Treponema putidum]UTY31415.1 hypothetical protein E4N75_07810 [Treponema putidum]